MAAAKFFVLSLLAGLVVVVAVLAAAMMARGNVETRAGLFILGSWICLAIQHYIAKRIAASSDEEAASRTVVSILAVLVFLLGVANG